MVVMSSSDANTHHPISFLRSKACQPCMRCPNFLACCLACAGPHIAVFTALLHLYVHFDMQSNPVSYAINCQVSTSLPNTKEFL